MNRPYQGAAVDYGPEGSAKTISKSAGIIEQAFELLVQAHDELTHELDKLETRLEPITRPQGPEAPPVPMGRGLGTPAPCLLAERLMATAERVRATSERVRSMTERCCL